jgi:aspartyl/asparaginyl beta-hydroxylase (cupin superfamily)
MKLDYHIFKDIVNGYLALHFDKAHRPTLFNIAEIYPKLDAVTKAYPAIRKEFERVMAEGLSLPQYHEVDSGERAISNTTPKRWNVFLLECVGYKVELNRQRCPETCRALARVPNMVQAFFSILDPGKSVPKHEGPYLGYLRYHLGLRVPKSNPPKIVVNAQDYVWKEGEAVLFDDSWPHEVINNSNELRAVLIVDVLRPLPFTGRIVNRFVTNVIGRYFYGRPVARKAEAFAKGAPPEKLAIA